MTRKRLKTTGKGKGAYFLNKLLYFYSKSDQRGEKGQGAEAREKEEETKMEENENEKTEKERKIATEDEEMVEAEEGEGEENEDGKQMEDSGTAQRQVNLKKIDKIGLDARGWIDGRG